MVYSVRCAIFGVQIVVYSVWCTVFGVQCVISTVLGLQCVVLSAQDIIGLNWPGSKCRLRDKYTTGGELG